jgi:hypothetical protein
LYARWYGNDEDGVGIRYLWLEVWWGNQDMILTVDMRL